MSPSDSPDPVKDDLHHTMDESQTPSKQSNEPTSPRSNEIDHNPSASGVDNGAVSGGDFHRDETTSESEASDRPTGDLPPLFDEIRHLHLRLRDLEAQAVLQWESAAGHTTLEHPSSSLEATSEQDNAELPARIRKATSARRMVRKVEKQALSIADTRRTYGHGPNDVPEEETGTFKSGGPGPTMYHVRQDGTMKEGTTQGAVYGGDGWYIEHNRDVPYYVWDEVKLRHSQRPYPHRGIRPPTALRPTHHGERAEKSRNPRPTKPTTKLGPPTRWDASDSDEWSSDTSTRSQDFRYFRSRLRGDFEWELDRLNAQAERFRNHEEKKTNRLAAAKALEEHDRTTEAYLASGLQSSVEGTISLGSGGKYGKSTLNPVTWEMFKLARKAPEELASVIDILTEEPKVGADPVRKLRKFKSSTIDKAKITGALGLRVPASEKAEQDEDAARAKPLAQSDRWNGQGPLPERIRINSRIIIECLSNIHGSAVCEASDQSMVVLRPFKILKVYDREIREMCAKVAEEEIVETNQQAPINDVTKKQNSLDTGSTSQNVPEDVSRTSEAIQSAPDLANIVSMEDQRAKKEHLACLQKFMDDYIGKKVEYLTSATCTKIGFFDLWHLFQPGTLVVSADGKQAYQVASIRSKRHKGTDSWDVWDFFGPPEATDSDSSNAGSEKESRHDHDITIKCVHVHFDGHVVGPALKTFGINKWDGEKDISFLDVFPLRLYVLNRLKERPVTTSTDQTFREDDIQKGVDSLRQKFVERGRLFVKVAAVKQMYYSGLAVNTRDEIESQVMVDFEAALSDDARKHWIPKIRRLVGTDWDSAKEKEGKACTAECCRGENVHDDSWVEKRNSQNFISSMMAKIEDTPHKLPSTIIFPRSLDDTKTEGNEFSEDELMLMSYSVFGFVLRDRTWAELDLDYMSEVTGSGTTMEQADDDFDRGNQGPFGQLVLPPGHKKMVLSLISQHFRNKGSTETSEEQVDIVRGKGKGLIILLHGAPGVGKTTTAEGVAETFGKPLFQITCGDLGSTPKEVESALQINFALANKWGCILLLDEADVFLAERRREDFNRNGMVAVFLRVLEYYAGILFLTTNRIGDFDEAFASRIHMSLHYPALDEISTMKVFKLNLDMIKNRLKDRIRIDEDEIVLAAVTHWREHKDARWNGRQIRNACQTALALAENDAQPKGQKYNIKEKTTAKVHLTLEHLKIVSDSYLEFTDYLKAVHGADAEGRAKESGLRALDTLLQALKSDKGRHNDDSSRQAPSDRDQRRPGANNSPLTSFTLRPASSNTGPSTPEPRAAQPTSQSGWAPASSQWSHDSPAFQAQRMEHNQHGSYTGHQSFNDPRTVTPTAQQGSGAGRHLHTPQAYGGPIHGQFQPPPFHQSQGSQSYGAAYLDVAPTHGHGGSSSQSLGPGYYEGGDQSGQGQQPSSSPFSGGEQT